MYEDFEQEHELSLRSVACLVSEDHCVHEALNVEVVVVILSTFKVLLGNSDIQMQGVSDFPPAGLVDMRSRYERREIVLAVSTTSSKYLATTLRSLLSSWL